MIYFPSIFFSFLLMWNIYKRGFDVYSYIVLIYTVSAFLSIFVDSMNLYKIYDIFDHPKGIVAPLAYCILLTICFEPFKKFNSNRIQKIVKINGTRYNFVVYSFFALFIINFAVSISRLQDIFLNNALGSIRDDFYHGDAEFMWSRYSGWFRYFIAICSLLSPCSVMMILFFFINISVLKRSTFFNCITVLGSFSRLIQSLFIADRSGFIHYIIIVGLCFTLMRKHMAKKTLKVIYVSGIAIISLLIYYLISVTISRFGGSDGSNMDNVYGSLIYYAGSSYIQFCNFFNVLDMNAPFSLVPIFPLTYYLLGLPGYFEQALIVESYYHHGVSNFSTFLGLILSISGKIVMVSFAICYYLVSAKIVYRKCVNTIAFKKLIYFFIVVLVVSNGLFGYYYMSYFSVVHILIWVFIGRWVSKNVGKSGQPLIANKKIIMEKKIKVLMIAPISKDKGGSYTTGVCKVAEALMDQRYDYSTIYLSSTNISNNKSKKISRYRYQYNGYRYLLTEIIKSLIVTPFRIVRELVFYKKKCHVNPLRFLFYRINIERQIKEIAPDIIHVHTTESPSVRFANKRHIPTIVTMHGFFYRGDPGQTEMLERLKNSTETFDFYTGLTKECQQLMIRYLGLNKNQIKIIPNGLETSKFFFDKDERDSIRKKMEVGCSTVFVTVASLQSRKGQLEFIKILQNIDIDWKYWIIGSGPDQEKIYKYCEINKLTDRVIILGHIESMQLYRYYSAADVYAHTSTMEGQSLSEMEAYATGLRIIVNEKLKDTIATDVSDERIYYLLDMDRVNYSDLKAWLIKEGNQRDSRTGIDWQEIAYMYDDLYKTLLKNKRHG